MPHSIAFNNRTITDPTDMNVFNNYFASIAKKANSNIKFSPKHYRNYLSYTKTNTFFLTQVDKNEISLIISVISFITDSFKSILILLKNDISQQLTDVFIMSFSTG